METSIIFYIFSGIAVLTALFFIRASWNIQPETNRGLYRGFYLLSWLLWLPMLLLFLVIGMVWPAPYSEGAQQQDDMCYYQTLGHTGKTVYELETYYEKRVDLVLSDLITGNEQKRISIIKGRKAMTNSVNIAWNGTTLAFMTEEALLTVIKGDSVLFQKDVSNDVLDKSISWDKTKKQWMVISSFDDTARSYLKADYYDADFVALQHTDTLPSDDTIQRPHFYFINGSWWGVNSLGWGGSSLYNAPASDKGMLHFTQVATGTTGDTAWWVPGVPWSLHNKKAKYLASAFGIEAYSRPSDFDTVYEPVVSPYAELRPDMAYFRFPWSSDDNDFVEQPAAQVSIRFDSLRVTMRKQPHHHSPFHSRSERELSWYGNTNNLLHNTLVADPCNAIFRKGDTLIVKGFGEGSRALFSISTGRRLDHPGIMASYRRYLSKPEKSNWPLLLPLIVLLILPLKQLLRRKTKKTTAIHLSEQISFAFLYLCLNVVAWCIVLYRIYS